MQRALNFTPGSAYSYTNTGFNILTILIERALGNGKTFQDFTREAIFEPLQMTHTRWRDDFRAVVPNRALSYGRAQGGGWIQDTPVENIIGAGGLLSTVGDWLLWNENFKHAKVGGPDVVKAQQTPAKLNDGRTITYAAGLEVRTYDGLREVSHSGSTGGYRTWIGRYPDRDVSVAVMCNSAQANPTTLGREVARLWTGAVASPKPAPFTVESSKLGELSGMYRKVRDNTVVELRMRDGKLTMGANTELVPSGESKFSAGENHVMFEGAGFRVVTPDGDTAYERVQPAHPTAADLSPLAGAYSGPDISAVVTVAAKGAELTLAIGSNSPVQLRPTFRDAFMMQGTAIRFLRGADGKVTGLSVGDDRAWDLRLNRVQ
jgi:hypothetical protein